MARTARNPEVRRRILLAGVLLTAFVASARSFQLGVLEGDRWRAKALDQQGDTLPLPAPRGTIYDRDGVPLAASEAVYSVAIAPGEVEDAEELRALLRTHLDMSERDARRVTETRRPWVVLPGRYGSAAAEALDQVSGVHLESVLQRFYPNGEVARELLGPVRLDGVALGGLELELDSILRGSAGRAVVRRDSRGRPLPGAMMRSVEPQPGRDVHLTIDYDLQEIAEQALEDALEETGSTGGELLLTDPRTGELLAAVSRGERGRARNWRAVTSPYEPGSTIKPFTVAALLRLRRATLADSVFAEDGSYTLHGRVLRDVHAEGWLTLGDALSKSSNIALAKAAARLTAAEQYAALRDFGFGSPTGVGYPSESSGRLRRPAQWSKQSGASLAIGYELSATPLQMAMAYGALANGGVLYEPRIVREVRARDGRVERSVDPRPVRRVITEDDAALLREVLAGAVEQGTGQAAALGEFAVAGKTGTARVAGDGGYRSGAYIASFAGFFPADDPQLVIIVKLEEPSGEYYGGRVAAPVTRATLMAALAARSTPIDRRAVARELSAPVALPVLANAPLPTTDEYALSTRTSSASAAAAPDLPLPDVAGMPMRDGVMRLHAAGFRVRVEGRGRVLRTQPAAGSLTRASDVVVVIGEVVS